MLTKSFIALAAAAALSGCALLQGQATADSAQILAEAGFEMQRTIAPGLPKHQLVAEARAAGTVYLFSDPDYCGCVYAGGAKEYAELQRLRAERLAEREWIRSRTIATGSIDPKLWGPWNPKGLDPLSPPAVAARTP